MKNNKYILYGGIGLAVVVGLVLINIVYKKVQQKTAEKMAENAIYQATGGKVDVDINGNSIKYKDENGGSVEVNNKGTEIPNEWPKEIKLYNNEKPMGIVRQPDSVSFIVKTKETDINKISAWYKSQFSKNGWEEQTSANVMGSFVGSYQKNNKIINISVTPNQSEGGFVITHNYQL